MAFECDRLRISSPDGLAASTVVSLVAADGTETPFTSIVSRVELTCDALDGMWRATLHIDEAAVEVVTDKIETTNASDIAEN